MIVKTTLKDTAPCEKVLSVAVPQDLIREEYDGFFRDAEKESRVPGFRPGKAPREVLEVHYRDQARERVLEKLIARSLGSAVKERKIHFLGRPTIRGVQFTDEKLTYEAVLEVPPKVRLGKYKGLKITRKPVEVSDDEMDQALKRMQESTAKFVAVENREARLGDFLIADYNCQIDMKEVDRREGDWIEIREEEYLRGFSKPLLGIHAGESREVRIQFPENFGRKEWASKEGVFQIQVKEIKEKQLLPLNDDLAKETGEFETLDQLKNKLKEQISAQKEREANAEFETAILDLLIKESKFEVPKGVVEQRLVYLVEAALESLHQRGTSKEVLEKKVKELFEKLRPEAEKQVRISFILDEISKQEKLTLDASDFEAKYQEAAAQHRQSPEAVKKYYEEHPDAKETLGIEILSEKSLQRVKNSMNAK